MRPVNVHMAASLNRLQSEVGVTFFYKPNIYTKKLMWGHRNMLQNILQELKKRSLKINDLERRAGEALAKDYDLEIYHDLLRQKAEILAKLPAELHETIETLDRHTKKYVINGLGGFSHGAVKALSLDSVFYMSALLYPENHRDDENNDLDDFINCLERGEF